MTTIAHELLSASAGTGKTYQLTSRFLRLLFLTGQPERIVALTFTRKAAAEFFHKIFQRLAEAAESAGGAARLSREVGVEVDAAVCRRQLRGLLESLHRLQLSTYDSFFSRIVQTFPFELGLAGPPTLLDEAQHRLAIQRAQDALSRRTQVDEKFLLEFWYACRQATMGTETKSIADVVENFVQKHHARYFEAPEARQWGDLDAIWPDGCPWTTEPLDLAKEAAALRAALPWSVLKPKQRQLWEEYLLQLPEWRPPMEMPPRVVYFLKAFVAQFDRLDSGCCEITVQSKQTLSVEVGRIAKRLARYGFWTELQPKLEATRGVYDLVRLFEEVYGAEIRQSGRITLADATRLLSGGVGGSALAEPGFREALAYRLDGWFDHWLLDEFQDTSHAQWAAIADLIDEVVQDAEGRRTFFAVGDVKQSIYRWRGSDDRLFARVAQRYQSALVTRTMAESYRSSPAVLAMVNQVFRDEGVVAEITGPEVARRWTEIWRDHVSAPSRREIPGGSCLVHAPENDPDCFATILALLQEIRPLERGLSAAVLMRENSAAEELVEYLRARGGPACSLAANVQAGRDSVVAAGLRSLTVVAAHPADLQAWVHLRMCPMGTRLEDEYRTPAALSAHLLELCGTGGLTALVDEWIRLCAPHLDVMDTFNARRLESCRQVAVELDQSGEVDLDVFLEALARLELREHDVPGQVAVMTIHKAKGLDWDVVILTDLDGKTLSERPKDSFEVQRDADGAVQWICQLPSSGLATHDQVLGARIEESRQDAAFERLCALYVGLTRAKRGLYVLMQAAQGSSLNYRRLLDTTLQAQPKSEQIGERTFEVAWREGDLNWFREVTPEPGTSGAATVVEHLPRAQRLGGRAPQPVRPSAAGRDGALRMRIESEADAGAARAFGSELHEVLAKIEWLNPPERAEPDVLKTALAGASRDVEAAVRRTLAQAEVRRLFVQPFAGREVWREMPFECIHGDAWVSGRFDRVLIDRDLAGEICGAVLVDFKTTQAAQTDPSVFEAQLSRYREVLAILCRIPVDTITVCVVLIGHEHVQVLHLLSGHPAPVVPRSPAD
jgi:ATP-dependent helicase/nuclease subunit A